MKCSFSIENNDIESGDGMTLCVENIDTPSLVIGKKCIVKLFEIDELVGKRKETTQNDLLAIFETEIIETSKKGVFVFDTSKIIRTDKFENKLPIEEVINDPLGNPLPIPLKFTPPHFIFYFDQGAPNPTGGYTVLIQSEASELEMYIYEIGFTIEVEGKLIYDARKIASYVDCVNVLAENCRNAAEFIRNNHNKLIKSRSVGTHFGDHFIYAYKTERAYLEMLSRHNNGVIDESWILTNTGVYWDNKKKLYFDSIVTNNGLQPTSCIDYVIDTMKLGFAKSQMGGEWKKISSYIKRGMGQWLAKGLSENGWVALYYNPDVNHPNDEDNEHIYSFLNAKNIKQYGSPSWPPIVPVFDMVVNYRPTPLLATGKFNQKPENVTTPIEINQLNLLKKVPFGFLMSRGGTHTALLCNDEVFEVHWEENYNSVKVFDRNSDFANSWGWNSGLIVIPKVFWPKPNYKFI